MLPLYEIHTFIRFKHKIQNSDEEFHNVFRCKDEPGLQINDL